MGRGVFPETEEIFMGHDYENMTLKQLELELKRLGNVLEDLEDTFNFNMANTMDHHNEAMIREHEDEMDEYRQQINRISRLLNERKDASKKK